MSYLNSAWNWLIAHWAVITLVAIPLVAKVLNKITVHWSERKGLVRWCLFVLDLLDLVKTTPPPSPVGSVLASNPKSSSSSGTLSSVLALLFLAATASGCAGWQTKVSLGVNETYVAAKALDDAAIPAVHKVELKEANACTLAKAATCPKMDAALTARHTIEDITTGLYLTVSAARAAIVLGQETKAGELLVKALTELANLQAAVIAAGVMK